MSGRGQGVLVRIAARTRIDRRALLGLVALVCGTLAWVLAFTGGLTSLFSGHTTTVTADFTSIEDIVPNDPVRINGVQVGTVAGERADPDGRGATLTMNISYSGPLYADASASILWRTALGANDAIAIDPGTRSAGPLGSRTIPRSRDSNQVELDQITQVFHGGAQSGIRTMLQQLAPALSAHPALARDLGTLAQVAPAATAGIGALRGEVQDTDLRDLVSDAGRAAEALSVGTGASQTRELVQTAASTLSALGAEPAALRATIADADVVLPHLAHTTHAVDETLYRVDPLIANLTPKVSRLAPALVALHPAVRDARTLLSDATPLLHRLRPTIDALVNSADAGVPVISAISPSLSRLGNTILPGLAEKGVEDGPHAPYELIGPVLTDLGGLAGYFDSDGHVAQLTLGLSDPQSVGLLPCTEDFSGKDFLVCDSLSTALGTVLGGGTSLLQSLLKRPGAAAIYAPLLSAAQRRQAAMVAADHGLASKFPALAKRLFGSGG
jgi:phospholipid/cholesterol/gamma-HCH transport system substrate-binding protein